MKKFIVLCLFGLLIMGLSAPVYAQIDFKAYGSLTAGFIASRNFGASSANITSHFAAPWVPGTGGPFDRPVNFFSEYANIFFEWNAGKEIKGVFNIETCDYHSGTNTTPNGAGDHAGAAFDTGLWNTRLPETRLRNAYVQFAVPYIGIPVPMNITAGIIPMATRPAFTFLLTNGAGIQLDIKPDPVSISLTWGKMAEGKIAVADDSNFWSLEGRANVGPATVGGYAIYQDMNTYPIVYNETAYGAPSSQYDAKIWWLGVYADGKIGPINFNFDFAYDNGKLQARDSGTCAGAHDVKYRGFATQAKVTYPWEKFAFGATGFYASGADLKKTSRTGYPGDSVADPYLADLDVTASKVGSWVLPAGSNQWVIWGESLFLGGHFSSIICIPQGMQAANWATNINRGANGGTWLAKLWASAQATPWYKITLWGLYIGDTTKNGNTLGNARKWDGSLRDDKSIGWELTLVQDINIYKNLILSFGTGMLFAGDAFDQYAGEIDGYHINKSPKNPYMLSSKLVYNF